MLSQQIIIRQAREVDRVGLEHIAARTWEGTDYLPRVITDWLADQDGEFFVATLPGSDANPERVVGAAKLTRLAADEWWLEGLRVDPDLYNQGIGRALQEYAVSRAETRGSGVVRFSTNMDNTAVQKLAEATGFVKACAYLRYHAGPQTSGRGRFYRLAANSIPAVRVFLDRSAYFHHAQRSSITRRWLAHQLTNERLELLAGEGQLYGWQGRSARPDALQGVVIAHQTIPTGKVAPELTITYMDAIPGGFALLAQTVRGLAAESGCGSLWYMLPIQPDRLVAIEQAGWRRPVDNSGRALLYSRRLGA